MSPSSPYRDVNSAVEHNRKCQTRKVCIVMRVIGAEAATRSIVAGAIVP
jgi:hypothetical protein